MKIRTILLSVIFLFAPVVVEAQVPPPTIELDIPVDLFNLGLQRISEGQVEIFYKTPEEVTALCSDHVIPKGQSIVGCTMRFDVPFLVPWWIIYISESLSEAESARVRAHEIAHVGGWTANHTYP